MFEKQCIKVVNVDPFSSPQLFPNICHFMHFGILQLCDMWLCVQPTAHVSMYHPWFTPSSRYYKVVLLFHTLISFVSYHRAMTSQQGHQNLKNSQHTHTYYIHNAMHFILWYTFSCTGGQPFSCSSQIQFCWGFILYTVDCTQPSLLHSNHTHSLELAC